MKTVSNAQMGFGISDVEPLGSAAVVLEGIMT
jgi:hypothetical protein